MSSTTNQAPEKRSLRDRIMQRSAEITARSGHSLDRREPTLPNSSPSAEEQQPLCGALGRMLECDAQEVLEVLSERDEARAHAAALAANATRLANWIQRHASEGDTEAMLLASEARAALAAYEASKEGK